MSRTDVIEGERPRVPLFATMNRIPGGLMLVPLVLGSVIGTFAPDALGIGSFTTALFQDSALPLIALLIFMTGTQVTGRTSGPVLAHAGVVLLMKSLVPAGLIVLLGLAVGIDGFWGLSILGLLAAFDNSNGGLWLAFTGRYGDSRDRGAYLASAINDGPFFTLLFLGASGLGDIPLLTLVAALVPFLLGMVVGNLDSQWRDVLRPVPNIVIPFFAFALGTGIDLGSVVTGGLTGLVMGVAVVLITGSLVYVGYRFLLRRGRKSGIGFAAATTAGNAIATPGVVAAADPRFAEFAGTATAQVAASVLVTAILAPLVASFVLKRAGGLTSEDAEDGEAGTAAGRSPEADRPAVPSTTTATGPTATGPTATGPTATGTTPTGAGATGGATGGATAPDVRDGAGRPGRDDGVPGPSA